jgi:uncharacterized HAD superfamily protein
VIPSKEKAVGIDIDGVLNEHRRHFCDLLLRHTGKALDPDAITAIPVHTIPSSPVTAEDEYAIFNLPDYWTLMPPAPGAAAALTRLRSAGLPIRLFSNRPWPDAAKFPDASASSYWHNWHRAAPWTILLRLAETAVGRRLGGRMVLASLRARPIHSLTVRWLKQHGIPYDQLTIEQSSTHADTGASGARLDRFAVAEQASMSFFIEDNPRNAARLAPHCRRVYLIDQPYNRQQPAGFPANIVRVNNWRDLLTEVAADFQLPVS